MAQVPGCDSDIQGVIYRREQSASPYLLIGPGSSWSVILQLQLQLHHLNEECSQIVKKLQDGLVIVCSLLYISSCRHLTSDMALVTSKGRFEVEISGLFWLLLYLQIDILDGHQVIKWSCHWHIIFMSLFRLNITQWSFSQVTSSIS